jgi:hypothetical protein
MATNLASLGHYDNVNPPMQPKMLSKACPAPVPSIHDDGARIERGIEAVDDEPGLPPTPEYCGVAANRRSVGFASFAVPFVINIAQTAREIRRTV